MRSMDRSQYLASPNGDGLGFGFGIFFGGKPLCVKRRGTPCLRFPNFKASPFLLPGMASRLQGLRMTLNSEVR